MKITLFQTDIVWAEKHANFKKVENLLHQVSGKTDLVVLPEMFSTGFCTDQVELAETMQGTTVKQLKQWAAKYQVAIAGSFLATDGSCYFNRGFIALPSGEFYHADKKHLFSYADEDKFISSGSNRLLVSYKGFNILLLICYDVRFPVWSRNVNNAYDLLIYTASFPHARMPAWDALLPARAIENLAYVCGVNRVGEDNNKTRYSGHSVLFDFAGKKLAHFDEFAEGITSVEIDKNALQHFRNKFGFWRDADKFTLDQKL